MPSLKKTFSAMDANFFRAGVIFNRFNRIRGEGWEEGEKEEKRDEERGCGREVTRIV